MDTITITRDGRTVALAGRERFWLAAHIQALPDRHPRRRHVCFMAVYARDILTGDMPGPYTDTDADHFARLVTNTRECDAISALASAPDGHGRAARPPRRRLAPASLSALPGRRARNRRRRYTRSSEGRTPAAGRRNLATTNCRVTF